MVLGWRSVVLGCFSDGSRVTIGWYGKFWVVLVWLWVVLGKWLWETILSSNGFYVAVAFLEVVLG